MNEPSLPHPYQVPGTWYCADCGADGESYVEPHFCARCGSAYVTFSEGDDDDEGC